MASSSKILCFGCSHSIGPYDNNNTVINNNGWITYLSDNIKSDKQWIGISLPGCGLAHYTLILDKLNTTGSLRNISDTIIQETSELRLTYKIYQEDYSLDKFIYRVTKSLSSENHIERNILPGYGVNLFSKDIIDCEELKLLNSPDTSKKMSDCISFTMDEYTENLWKSGLVDVLLKSMKSNIQTICNENNITLHTISWKDTITKVIEDHNVKDNGYGHYGKYTVDIINELFYNELKDKL